MADLSIRNLDADVKRRLHLRAAEHGRSMEAEVREILAEAVRDPTTPVNPFRYFHERFARVGGVDLDLPPRDAPARVPDLS